MIRTLLTFVTVPPQALILYFFRGNSNIENLEVSIFNNINYVPNNAANSKSRSTITYLNNKYAQITFNYHKKSNFSLGT